MAEVKDMEKKLRKPGKKDKTTGREVERPPSRPASASSEEDGKPGGAAVRGVKQYLLQ